MARGGEVVRRLAAAEPAADEEGSVQKSGNIVEFTDAEGNTQKYTLAYRITNRGGKGVKTINITEKTGALVGLLLVDEKDDLIITCESGVTIRMKVSQIREAGRATQGVRLINIDEGDKIAAIACLREQEEAAGEVETAEGDASTTAENGEAANPDETATHPANDEPTETVPE